MGILERGGNAFDAAVATAFTLQVVEPHLNGPGGDVPIIVHDVKRGRTEVICGQGPAPAGATIAHYRSLGLDLIPGTGLLAPCMPGCFDAFMLLLRDYGTMRLADVLAPAIGYARNGHPLVERASATIATVRDQFLDTLADFGGALARPRQRPRARHHVPQPDPRRNLRARPARGCRGGRPRGRDRAGAQDLVAGFCGRGHRRVLPHPGGDGRVGPRPSRRADRRRHGGLVGHGRSADRLRLRPLSRAEARSLVPGARRRCSSSRC